MILKDYWANLPLLNCLENSLKVDVWLEEKGEAKIGINGFQASELLHPHMLMRSDSVIAKVRLRGPNLTIVGDKAAANGLLIEKMWLITANAAEYIDQNYNSEIVIKDEYKLVDIHYSLVNKLDIKNLFIPINDSCEV